MKRHFITLMKVSILSSALVGMLIMSGCGDDEPTTDPLVGKYRLTNATLAAELTIVLTGATEAATCESGFKTP